MSSTESSTASLPPEPVYRGPQYRSALGPANSPAALDPLVHPDPHHPPRLYRFLLGLVRVLLRLCFRLQVEGLENIPAAPFIIASNHQAWYDTIFIVAAFPLDVMVYTMAKRETVFNRAWKRWLVTRCGVFPISPRQGELDERAVATVYQVLARGAVLLIFPEGRYSRGRALRPLKKGVAHFALQAGVPICPVAVSGLDRLRPFGRVTVSIGPPIHPDPPAWWVLNRRVARVVDRVRRGILSAFGKGPEARAERLLDRLGGRLRRLLRRPTSPPGR